MFVLTRRVSSSPSLTLASRAELPGTRNLDPNSMGSELLQ